MQAAFAQTYSANTSVTANNNVVAVTGGLLKAGIAGGYILGNHNAASARGEANGNIVFVGGSAKVNGDIYGANAEFKTGDTTASMNNNMVIVSGNADISNAALHGIGSSGSSGGKISGSGNTLVINGWHGSVKTLWTVLIMWCLRKLPGRITAKC